MEFRSRHYKVGLFVMVGTGLFFTLIALAIGPGLWREKVTYRVHYRETIKGMVIGSKVNFKGVTIGSVSDMRFVDGRIEVTIEVDPERSPIQEVTRASLDRAWVTGQVTVELSGWKRGGKALPPGGVIEADLSTMGRVASTLPEITEKLGGLLEEYTRLGSNLNQTLNLENRERLSGILDQLEKLLGSTNERVPGILAKVEERLIPDLTALVGSLEAIMPGLLKGSKDFGEVAANLARLSGHPSAERLLVEAEGLAVTFQDTAEELGKAAGELSSLLRGNRRDLSLLLSSLHRALAEFQALARLLRNTPSALVFGRPKGEKTIPASPGGGDR